MRRTQHGCGLSRPELYLGRGSLAGGRAPPSTVVGRRNGARRVTPRRRVRGRGEHSFMCRARRRVRWTRVKLPCSRGQASGVSEDLLVVVHRHDKVPRGRFDEWNVQAARGSVISTSPGPGRTSSRLPVSSKAR